MGYFLSLLFLLFATPAFATYCPNCGGTGGISAVTGTAPIAVTAGATPVVSIAAATCANDGTHALTNPAGIALVCGVITAGAGTVTSVGLASNFPGVTLSGTPVTTSGTLTQTLANQNAHFTLIGPTSGSAALPTWRALVPADIPIASASAIGGVQSKVVVTSNFLTGISSVDGSVSAGPINYTDLAGTQPTTIVSTSTSIPSNTTLSYPGVNKSSIQFLTFTSSSTVTIPTATWIGQQVQLFMCQDATGGRIWNVNTSGVTLRGVFAVATTTPNICQICNLSYARSTSEAFLTNNGCTDPE